MLPDKSGPLSCYTQFFIELAATIIDLSYHVHAILQSNVYFNTLFLEVILYQHRYLKHKLNKIKFIFENCFNIYRWEKVCSIATQDEIDRNDDVCAYCWENMEHARKLLKCNHLFHALCLTQWLNVDWSCPTCRGELQ